MPHLGTKKYKRDAHMVCIPLTLTPIGINN